MKILLNITHGFQARMLLRTEIAEHLREAGCDLVVVSPNADEAYLQSELSAPGYSLLPMPERYSKIEKAVVTTRAYALMNPSLGATLHYTRERFKRHYPWRARAARVANVVLGRVPALRRAYLRAESRVFSGREFDELLSREAPNLVVAGTPGFNVKDAHLLRAAHRLGIPSATVMLSWDNLTSKGYMSAQPDHLLVWSDLMADEALRYHDYGGTIIEVGASQFDVYPRVLEVGDRAAFVAHHGIPADASLVVWGTISNVIYPNQLDLLRQYVAELQRPNNRSKFLWVRIHPQTVSGPYQALMEEYRALESDRVKVELPAVRSEKLQWDLPKEDMWHLASLLAAANVVVTPRSTLTIDAACADTPVINLAIDPAFAVGFNYTHYKNIVKHDGAWIVHNFDELCTAVDACVADPSARRVGRRAIVSEQLGRWYGRAGRRTAEVLTGLATDADMSRRVRSARLVTPSGRDGLL